MIARALRRIARVAAACALPLLALAAPQAAQACTGGACVIAGPRLASVSTTQGPLLNALLGSLTGSSLTISAVDWNAVAGGDISLLKTLNALQTTLGVATPQAALNTPITIAQLAGAASTAASQQGLTSVSVGLADIAAQITVPGTITLGTLLNSDGLVGTTSINALSLLTGAVQLFNSSNVATTTTPITVSGASLGNANLVSVQVQAQAIEPPVYVCGPVGSTFHSSAIRVKLAMTLVSLTPSAGSINLLPGITDAAVTLGQMQVYVEVAHAAGIITAVNAVTNAMSLQVTPGVASLYLGDLGSYFFQRGHAIVPATDLGYAVIGNLHILGLDLNIGAKAAAVGNAPTPTPMTFNGAGVQTQTASSGASFASSLVTSLFSNLSISLPTLGLGTTLDNTVNGLVVPIVSGALSPVLSSLTTSLINPLLSTLGIRLGEVDVTSGGEYMECAVSGCVYADANHNARQDTGETGIGTTLYAKLVPTATPTVAAFVATVDPSTGNYSFPTLNPAVYTVVISTSNSATVVTPSVPSGWIGTENPSFSRSLTVVAADLGNQSFGLYHGSTVAGTVFKDNGAGTGGIANNGLKDGTEAGIGGTVVNVTDSSGATVYDSGPADPTGAYLLWVPSTATGVLKVAQAANAQMVVVSGRPGTTAGTFTLASSSTGFTPVAGSLYTGVDFGDVPINRLDTDGQQSVAAGTTAIYAHAFHAGSAGQLTLSVAPLAAVPVGWSATTWLDANCDGQLNSGETALTGAFPVVADQNVCIIVKVFVPQTAANETRATYVLNAAFAYANSTLTGQATRQDITIVGAADGMRLVKTVDKTTATSGTVITYTLAYVNQGAAAVSSLKIRDTTPAWTVLDGAACGSLPAGITGCSVTAQPAVGAAGSVEFTLTGSLPSGGTGSVQFSVKVL